MPFSEKGAVLVRLDGRIAFANTYFCKLVGIPHSQVAGMSCFDFVFPEDLDLAKQVFEINNALKAEPFSFRLRRIDGAPAWADIQCAAIKTASGKVYAVNATVTRACRVEGAELVSNASPDIRFGKSSTENRTRAEGSNNVTA